MSRTIERIKNSVSSEHADQTTCLRGITLVLCEIAEHLEKISEKTETGNREYKRGFKDGNDYAFPGEGIG